MLSTRQKLAPLYSRGSRYLRQYGEAASQVTGPTRRRLSLTNHPKVHYEQRNRKTKEKQKASQEDASQVIGRCLCKKPASCGLFAVWQKVFLVV
jgi:hypothetical protein